MNYNNASKVTKLTILCAMLALLAALAGCESMVIKKNDPVPKGKGMVVVHVANAVLDNENWGWVELWSESEKRVYSIYREPGKELSIFEYPTTAHFSGALPPGIYTIDAFKWQTRSGSLIRTSTAPVHDKIGKFKIEAGRLTDLGTLLFYPEFWVTGIGGFQTFSIGNIDTVRVFKQRNPVAYNSLTSKSTLGWLENKARPKDLIKSMAIKSLPRFNQIFETTDGELFAGGMLGKIFKRNTSGKWETLDTGTLLEIYRIEKSEKALYATSERSVLKSKDGGSSWESLNLPATAGRLEFFHIEENGGQYAYLLTGTTIFNSYKLYHRNDESDPWTVVASDTYDTGKVDNILPSMYHIASQNGLGFTAGNLNNFMLSDHRKNVSRDLIVGYKHIHYFDDGGLYGIDYEINMSLTNPIKNPALSFYDPIRRTSDTRERWMGAIVDDVFFSNRQTGYVVIKVDEKSKSQILKTGNSGKTWKPIPGSEGAYKIYVTRKGTILKLGVAGSVYSTSDEGKHWTRERGTLNLIAAAKALRKK